MNEDLMCQYIEAVADRIADLFEFDRVFNTENPSILESFRCAKCN